MRSNPSIVSRRTTRFHFFNDNTVIVVGTRCYKIVYDHVELTIPQCNFFEQRIFNVKKIL